MHKLLIPLAAVFIGFPLAAAYADDQGTLTGAAGGAVTGAIVGGPVGAVVGGVAGAAIGGAATGPGPVVVQPAPSPCASRSVQRTDNTGYSQTTTTTDCPP